MNRGTLILLITLPVAGLVLELAGLLTPIKSATQRIASPLTGAVTHATLTSREMIRAIGTLPALVRENNELAAENRKLKAELATSTDLFHENDHLRSELGLPKGDRNRTGIASFVIGRTSTGAFGTLTINRGGKDGLKVGQVAVSQGVLVGRLQEVSEATSILLPITNVNSVIPVTLAESRGIGLLKGGVKGLTVEEISRDVVVKNHEAVVTSPLGGIVPEGIFVGDVEAVTGNPADVFQSAAVSSPVPFNWLELVIVLP